jgi:hypothetical protein
MTPAMQQAAAPPTLVAPMAAVPPGGTGPAFVWPDPTAGSPSSSSDDQDMFDILSNLDPPAPVFELSDSASYYRSNVWDTTHHQAELSTLPFPGLRSRVVFGTQERVEAPYGSSITTTFRVRDHDPDTWAGPLPADSLPEFQLALRSAPVTRKKVRKEWRLQAAPEDAPADHSKELIVAIDNGAGKLTAFSARAAEGRQAVANATRAAIIRDGTVTLRWKSMKATSKMDDRAVQLCLSWAGGELASDPLVVLSAPTKAKGDSHDSPTSGGGAAAAAAGGGAAAPEPRSFLSATFCRSPAFPADFDSLPEAKKQGEWTTAKRKRKRSDDDDPQSLSPTSTAPAPEGAGAGGLMEQLAALQLSGLLRPTSAWTAAEKRALIGACLD